MAKNWSVSEAVEAINNGDKESIVDIGRRFPLLLNSAKGALAGDKQSFLDFVAALPEYDTANKINKRMKDGIEASEDVDVDADVDAVEEKKPAKKTAAKKAAGKDAKKAKEEEPVDDGEVDYSEMDAKELFTLCKERGIKAAVKKPAKYYIGLLEKADAEDADDEEDWDEEEEDKVTVIKADKSEKKPARKAKKEEPEDDDDEWDI